MEIGAIAAVLVILLSGIASTDGSCSPGYYGYYCEKECLPTCESCTSLHECGSCKPGYYGSDCLEICDTRCLTCKSNDTCGTCKPGYYGSDCLEICDTRCLTCKSNDKCDTCKPGYYGIKCDLTCPRSCGTCFPNGTCLHYPSACCLTGQYTGCVSDISGLVCITECPKMCYNNICDTNTGHCYNCKDGYFGTFCNDRCPDKCIACSSFDNCVLCKDGFFGQTCEHHCPKTCQSCHTATYCDLCKNGNFGPTCTETCTLYKTNSACRQTDGVCIVACADGFSGEYCNETCDKDCKSCKRDMPNECTVCVTGKYGRSYGKRKACSKHCPDNCFNNICNEIGSCDQGCKPNFYGQTCQQPCPLNCVNNICYQEKGTCKYGCSDGFYKTDCSGKCADFDPMCAVCSDVNIEDSHCRKCHTGFYQNKLGQCVECPITCKSRTCTTRTGHCVNGCKDGFWAESCNKICSDQCGKCMQINGTCTMCVAGKYSLNCSLECSTTCKQTPDGRRICDIITGECIDGCKPGFYGDKCTLDCTERCGNTSCYRATGACDYANGHTSSEQSPVAWIVGVSGGGLAFIAIVVIITLVCFIRNRNGKYKDAAAIETCDSNAGVALGEFNGQAVQSQVPTGTSSGEDPGDAPLTHTDYLTVVMF